MAPYVASVALGPEPESPSAARRFVRDWLHAWDIGTDEDDVALMVSELVTNVGLHARTDAVVHVSLRDDCLRVEVRDRSAQPVELRPHEIGAETGRGLRIVEALAARWGVEAAPHGKYVWFEVPVRRESSTGLGRATADGASAP